jgi:hypothetical protein
MIAIHTKFLSPTNRSGARIKAYTCSSMGLKGFQATISYPYELDGVLCHFEAVKVLIEKNNLDWNPESMRYGDSADGKGFSFCFASSTIDHAKGFLK